MNEIAPYPEVQKGSPDSNPDGRKITSEQISKTLLESSAYSTIITLKENGLFHGCF